MTDVTTCADCRALLAGVLDEPAADLPRLVFADYLEDTGDAGHCARAEFVRVTVGMARHTDCPDLLRGRRLRCGACDYCRGRWAISDSRTDWLPGVNHSFCGEPGPFDQPVDYGPGPHLTVTRGFVSAVRLTQAAFAGGECAHCNGSGAYGYYDVRECRACHGTGRTPGLAAALFAAHPITTINFTDTGVRVEIEPPAGWYGWRAHFHRVDARGETYRPPDTREWKYREELAAGIALVAFEDVIHAHRSA